MEKLDFWSTQRQQSSSHQHSALCSQTGNSRTDSDRRERWSYGTVSLGTKSRAELRPSTTLCCSREILRPANVEADVSPAGACRRIRLRFRNLCLQFGQTDVESTGPATVVLCV